MATNRGTGGVRGEEQETEEVFKGEVLESPVGSFFCKNKKRGSSCGLKKGTYMLYFPFITF